MKAFVRLFAPLLLAVTLVHASAETASTYQPTQTVSGVLHLSGNPEMKALVVRWSAGFQKYHPTARIETHLTGSDTGMAALYTSKADIALLGRTPTASEIQAFEWVFHYKPSQLEIMTGSLDHAGKSPALFVVVHRENPLTQITLAQLDAIFGTEHRLSPANIRTWGQLGLTGEWADKPIMLYAPDVTSGTGRFFRHAVLNDSRMMNWEQLTEMNDTPDANGTEHDAGRKIIAALAADRFGLAVANMGFANGHVRPVALAPTGASTPVLATRDNLIARLYPLTRDAWACYNRKPGASLDPRVREFLRYILSREGQHDVEQDDGYLPLTPGLSADRLKKLE